MISSISDSPLFKIAQPESILFLGASNDYSSMGSVILYSVLSGGYKGGIYPVHHKEDIVQNLRAYRRIEDLPDVPDMAFIVLPTKIVAQALEACGKKGIKNAIIVSAGFSEVGEDGAKKQKELCEIADRYNIRFTGPNCIGVVNSHLNLNATFLQAEGKTGYIGMASQSGSFITQMFGYLNSRFGQGFSTAFSLGNEANIDMVECIEYLGACPNTKVIALYIESIRRGKEFIEAARSVSLKKPIVAFYVGGSETGKRASLSHTGAMSGPDDLYNGVFRQSGIIRARSIEELFDFSYVLGALPVPDNNRVIIQTHSGGPGAACADACERAGLELPQLSQETLEKLSPFIPHTGSVNNPIDLTFIKNQMDYFKDIPAILLEDENADALMIYFLSGDSMMRSYMKAMGVSKEETNRFISESIATQVEALIEQVKNQKKPVIGFSFLTRENPFISQFQDHGLPVLLSPERAARAYGALVQYKNYREKLIQSAS